MIPLLTLREARRVLDVSSSDAQPCGEVAEGGKPTVLLASWKFMNAVGDWRPWGPEVAKSWKSCC